MPPNPALLRRANLVELIGEALTATHVDRLSRKQVVTRVRLPPDTLRGWLRRFRKRDEEIRIIFAGWLTRWHSPCRLPR